MVLYYTIYSQVMGKQKELEEFIAHYKELPSWVYYQDSKTYRETIRKIFRFDESKTASYIAGIKTEVYAEMDEESKDELTFDENQMEKGMDFLYEITKDQPLFFDLYTLAAGCMFSTDPKIGQVVICSYDTLLHYHTIVWFFLHGGFSAVKSCPAYEKLRVHFRCVN
jgi:hypothetical protein